MRQISNILSLLISIATLTSFQSLYSTLPTTCPSPSYPCFLFVHSFSPSSPLLSLSQLRKTHHEKNHPHRYPEENVISPTLAFKTTTTTTSPSSYPSSALYALKKSQTAVYDGAEFVSILTYLITEPNARIEIPKNDEEEGTKGGKNIIQMQSNEMPSKKAGYMTFVAGTIPPTNKDRVVAVRAPSPSPTDDDTDSGLTLLDNNVYVYTDSIAVIPNGINDNDAISTASAALCGVHCGSMGIESKNDNDDSNTGEKKIKTVILGGGDYACFIAKALTTIGREVYLVTTRPMSLKDTPLNPLRGSNVNTIAPITENENKDEDLGFSEVIGQFDTVIDTLGDEANMNKVRFIQDGIDRCFGTAGVSAKLAAENKCSRYISTLTKSQMFVLKEGILFARDPVLNYQRDVEADQNLINTIISYDENDDGNDDDEIDDTSNEIDTMFQILPPPLNYGKTIEKLFQGKIIYPSERNENGNHATKKLFVRGCSFPDYAEIEIWPQDSSEGAAVRFGFPGIQELTLEARMEKVMGTFDSSSDNNGQINVSKSGGSISEGNSSLKKKRKSKQENPFVVDIESLGDITEEIRNEKKDAVLFVSAPYCRLCRSIGPLYNRMARISKEELDSDLVFAKATTGSSKAMKQLTFTLQVDSVPTMVLFRKGERYGQAFGVSKLPSVKLNQAIERLKTGKEWDPEIIEIEEGGAKLRTKI